MGILYKKLLYHQIFHEVLWDYVDDLVDELGYDFSCWFCLDLEDCYKVLLFEFKDKEQFELISSMVMKFLYDFFISCLKRVVFLKCSFGITFGKLCKIKDCDYGTAYLI